MSWPNTVSLITGTVGDSLGSSGESADRIYVAVTPVFGEGVHRLLHAATGTVWDDRAVVTSGTPALFVQVPHVDQPGFVDGLGNEVTDWYYLVQVITRAGTGKSQWSYYWQPRVAAGDTVDLDTLGDGVLVTDPVLVYTPGRDAADARKASAQALASAQAAEESRTASAGSAQAAAGSAQAAAQSAQNADTSVTDALAAQNGAEAAESNAEDQAAAAAASAGQAATAGAAAGSTAGAAAGATAGAAAGSTTATSYVSGQKGAANGIAPLDGSQKLPESNVPDRLTATGLASALVPRWQANHAYTAGDTVLAPDGSLVKAISTFTSGSSYVSANWTGVSVTPGTQAAAELAAVVASQVSSEQSRAGAVEVALQAQVDGFTGLGTYQGAWSATAYSAKDIVSSGGNLYYASTAATASDVPGTAPLWKVMPATVDSVARAQSAPVSSYVTALVQRTNLAPNPGPTIVGTGGWASTSSTLYGVAVRDSAVQRRAGINSVRVTRTASSPDAFIGTWNRLGQGVTTPTGAIPVAPSTAYRLGIYMRASVPGQGQLSITWYDSSNTVIGTSLNGTLQPMATANTWTKISFGNTVTSPANAAFAMLGGNVRVPSGNSASGDQAWVTDAWVTAASEPDGDYFDGDMGTTGTGSAQRTHTWVGTVGASSSREGAMPATQDQVDTSLATGLRVPRDAVATRVNKATSPTPTANGGWLTSSTANYGSTVLDTTTVARPGTTSARLTRTATALDSNIGSWTRVGQHVTAAANGAAGVIDVSDKAGGSFYASVKMYCSVACKGQISVSFYNAAGTLVTPPGTQNLALNDVPATTWTTVGAAVQVPATAVTMMLGAAARTTDGSNAVAGTNLWVQDAMVGNGTFFDGAMAAAADETYAWTGTAYQSAAYAVRPQRTVQVESYMPNSLKLTPEQVLRDTARTAKGGVIGTAGKGVVALRFDHWFNALMSTVVPLLVARGLPGGVASYSGMLTPGDPYQDTGSTGYSWTDMQTACVHNGLEQWGHSYSHADTPNAGGMGALIKEVITSKADLEAAMPQVKIQGWMQPGVSPMAGAALPYTTADGPLKVGLDSTDPATFWKSDAGLLIRQTYGLIEADGLSRIRHLPTGPMIGAGHYTADTMNLASLKALVDYAVAHQSGVEILLHAGLIDTVGKITLADYTAFLDYLVTKRDAGQLEVLTPSGLFFADPGSTRRAALVAQGDFTGFNTAAPGLWASLTGVTTGTDGGVGHVELAAGGSMIQDYPYLAQSYFGGEVFEVNCQVRRAVSGTPATARIVLSDPAGGWTETYTNAIPSGTGWTTWRFPFGIPIGRATARTLIGHSSGGAVQFRNVTVPKV